MSTVQVMEEITEECHYVIDWGWPNGVNRTNHPLFCGENNHPPYGAPPINRIWLDGVEISDKFIRCLMTGPDGWVEIMSKHADNTPVLEIYNNWDQCWEEITDEWRSTHHYQVRDPNNPIAKYGEERIKLTVLKGHVVWKYTPTA